MAAFLNLLLALAFALIVPVVQRMAPAIASGAAAPQLPAAITEPTAPFDWNWSVACRERDGASSETRHVRVVVGQIREAEPCELRFIALPTPPAPPLTASATDA
jgi:hypothetical protein